MRVLRRDVTFTITKIWIFSLSSVPNTQKCKGTGGATYVSSKVATQHKNMFKIQKVSGLE
jgi:hypothetical protein